MRPRITSVARSAIIITGEAVLPETILGMIEASTIRSPDTTFTFSYGPPTASLSIPIRQVPTGWNNIEVAMSPALAAS